jgi:Flp pilus assembly protein CpaB
MDVNVGLGLIVLVLLMTALGGGGIVITTRRARRAEAALVAEAAARGKSERQLIVAEEELRFLKARWEAAKAAIPALRAVEQEIKVFTYYFPEGSPNMELNIWEALKKDK